MQEESPEEGRAWLLGAAVVGMNLLASMAERAGAPDLRSSFLSAAAVWGQWEREEALPTLQPQPRPD